jgi:hypothetical protein
VFGRLACHAAARRDSVVLVGLEIPSSAQPSLDAFLDGAGGKEAEDALSQHAFWQREYQDGRSSRAVLDLLAQLRRWRAAGRNLVVQAIDSESFTSAAERDVRMAETLSAAIEAWRPTQTLVLAGDVHSRTLSGYPWDPQADYLPLGALLRARFPDVLGLRVRSSGGAAWTCLSPDAAACGVHPVRPVEVRGPIPRIELDPVAAASTGWDGTLYLGTLQASLPATGGARPSS